MKHTLPIILLLTLLCGPAHAIDDTAQLTLLLNEFLAGTSVNDAAEDVRIRLYDDMAVVAFRLLGTVHGDPGWVALYLNTSTFQKREGEWKAVAWQATRIPDPD